MQVKDAMSYDIALVNPEESIRHAAELMAQLDIGILPVGENQHLVGMITDRDIAVRAVARGRDGETPIREVMSQGVMYCYDDNEIDDVADNMAEVKVRRLAVIDHRKRLVGMLSLGDIALAQGPEAAGVAISGIAAREINGPAAMTPSR